MLFYIIFFASAYIALSTVTVYGFVDRWYWLIFASLIFINVFMLGVAAHFIYCAFLSLFVNTKKLLLWIFFHYSAKSMHALVAVYGLTFVSAASTSTE